MGSTTLLPGTTIYCQIGTRHDSVDGHGGVGTYINENMSFLKRDDLTIFITHVIESLFVEVKIN